MKFQCAFQVLGTILMKIVRDVSLKNSRKVMVSLTWWSVLLYGIILEEHCRNIYLCPASASPPPNYHPPSGLDTCSQAEKVQDGNVTGTLNGSIHI